MRTGKLPHLIFDTKIKSHFTLYQIIELERLERLARSKKVIDDFLRKTPRTIIEGYELKTSKSVKKVVAAIVNALQVPPAFKVNGNTSPQPETFAIYATQIDPGILSDTGCRQCLIVCGQMSDTETQTYFEDVEYKAKHKVSMQGLLAFKDNEEFIPIHPKFQT